jgi:Phasin protein
MAGTTAGGDHPLPGFDPEAIIAAQSRYIEAWANAGQIMADAVRVVAQRQSELANAGIRDFWADSQAMLEARPSERHPAEQLRSFYEQAFANFQELSGILIKAQAEAMSVLSNCAAADPGRDHRAAA